MAKKARVAEAEIAAATKTKRKAKPAAAKKPPKAKHGGTPVAEVQAKHAAQQQSPRGHVGKIISANGLNNLTRKVNALDDQKAELSSETSKLISGSVKTDQLHRKAFSLHKWMKKQNIQKCAEFWDSLNHYVDISGLGDDMTSRPQLNLEAAPAEEGADEDQVGDETSGEGDDTGGDDDGISRPRFGDSSRLVA